MEEKRVADYFVVAGLSIDPQPLEEFSNEAVMKSASKQDPITDIAVINKSLGERVPKGYTCVESTPSGLQADLNHGTLRCPEMYLCFKRSRDKPPLTDIGVIYDGKERLMNGCEIIHSTPYGHSANVNNSTTTCIYITYRRAPETCSIDTLVVVDICVILENKNEEPPLTYNKIVKTLNKGMLGSDVYLCYKKAISKSEVLSYKPVVLSRFPFNDFENFPLPESVPMFCLPMGVSLECWSSDAQHPPPIFSTFVLTALSGEKIYGAAVMFYEEYSEDKLSDVQLRHLSLKNKCIRQQYGILKTVYANKSICLLSHWPFFDAFKKFLSYLYKISLTSPHNVPIERHISHFMYEVPYPSPQRPRILVQLEDDSISFCMPDDSPLPQSGASYISMLKNLGPENCMNILLCLLLEHKILIHSLCPAVLTGVAEAFTNILFPFSWQCPYIPLCPIGLSDVLNAPCPFIVGVDSRYFDLYDPPQDIICVDLDTNRIWLPEDKKFLSYKQLPKKPLKILQENLYGLFMTVTDQIEQMNPRDETNLEMETIDLGFKRKKREMAMDLDIQEAFLHFMSSMLKGYRCFLKPISIQPSLNTTNASSLFDMQGFLKSREKSNVKFYNQMMKTQMFIRFIEERSFVSDNDASLTFFDECSEKVNEDKVEPKLIEKENTQRSERTVFVMPPDLSGLPKDVKYFYSSFPELKPELLLLKTPSSLSLSNKQSLCPNSPFGRRTKLEIRSAQKHVQNQGDVPENWAKCLLSHCYSLWFIGLVSMVHLSTDKEQSLLTARTLLNQMQEYNLNSKDEVCYRIVMQLCAQYNKPSLAIKVFSDMKKYGIQANAITYGFYNRVMLESQWSSQIKGKNKTWIKLRNVLIGIAKFRKRQHFDTETEYEVVCNEDGKHESDHCPTTEVPDTESSDSCLKAIEIEMTSCSRCYRCHSLLYDEEIMSGWSTDDSNLNTKCPFCPSRFVPNLHIYVKDSRTINKTEQVKDGVDSRCANATTTEEPYHEFSSPSLSTQISNESESEFLIMQNTAQDSLKRCRSECFINTDYISPHDFHQDVKLPVNTSRTEEDIMSRCVSIIEPIVVPYLSPIVLRKELEHVIENDGDLCLSTHTFLDEHPILFWNLIWYFKRIDVPNHLTEFILSSKLIDKREESLQKYSSSNVFIETLWDNTRLHEEVGLPMYIAWNSGKPTSMIDALITETQPYSRTVMQRIFTSIQCNDVLTSIKLVVNGRKRLSLKKQRFRSMYREILFLVFIACGRENIDHDAFDREYKKAYKQLNLGELCLLQDNDKPCNDFVVWCRRVFTELKL